MEFGLIISDTNRSKAYIKLLVKNLLYPKEIFFYSKKTNKFFLKYFLKKNIKYYYAKTENINNPHFIKVILKSKLKNYKSIINLSEKKFLNVYLWLLINYNF